MTPDTVRVAGAPRWSWSGELAAGAFDGVRRGVILIDPDRGAARWSIRPDSSSYRLLALGPGGDDALAIRADGDGSARLVRARARTVPTNPCNCFAQPTKPESR